MLVLIPGIGRTVNGSTRWIVAGPINIQVSEIVKICAMMYVAGYLVRRSDEVRERFSGFIKPMLLLSVMVAFLMKQPDFGAVVVIMVSVLVMLFLGGVKFGQFLLVLLGSIGAGALMVFSSSYRMKRVLGYIDPWAEQYASGYQLVQSLIAFGRGEWTGVGLGNSIQKLFYLPEAHTDFVFAVMAEEFGLIGNMLVLGVFMALVFTGLSIGRAAERQGKRFNGYLVYGLSVMLGMQALVNMGVSSGLLPTKGLTLPLISYGGSSLIIVCVVLALIMRADYENSQHLKKSPSKQPNLNLEVTG
jgi:cell division protein FtsW